MKMEVDIDSDELDKYLVDQLRYWSEKENHGGKHPDDKKDAKRVIRAAKVLLEWYGG